MIRDIKISIHTIDGIRFFDIYFFISYRKMPIILRLNDAMSAKAAMVKVMKLAVGLMEF